MIEEISFYASSGSSDADPSLGSLVEYRYLFSGTSLSGGSTMQQASYSENANVAQAAGYGSVSPFEGSVGNYSFGTGFYSFRGSPGTLFIINNSLFDTTPLLDSFASESGLIGVPTQLEGDSIIFLSDSDFSRTSGASYKHTLVVLNDPSGNAFDSAFFGDVDASIDDFTSAKLYHESVTGSPVGITYNLSFVADLKAVPEPAGIMLVVLGAIPLFRRNRA